MNHPEFGPISHEVDAWNGEVAFNHPVSGTERVGLHIRSDESGPTDVQRALFRELTVRYESLWPQIAAHLLTLPTDAKRLPALLRPTVYLNIPGIIGSTLVDITLVYEFNTDEIRKGSIF